MCRDELKAVVERPCRRHGVKRLELFGSVARGAEPASSDVDLLVDFAEMSAGDYSKHYFDLLHELEDLLGRPVDLLTVGSLRRPTLQNNIARDAVLIYESGVLSGLRKN